MKTSSTDTKSYIGFFTGLFILGFCLIGNSTAEAKARAGKAHFAGAGLAYSTMNHSLFVNPAVLVDSPKTSIQGSYLLDPEQIHGSATFGMGNLGAGFGYRQAGTDSEVIEAGIAFRANALSIGTTIKSDFDFDAMDADIAANFELSKMRLAVIARNVNLGMSRLDFGIGILNGPLTIGLDSKVLWIDGRKFKDYLFDASVAYSMNKLHLSAGYTFTYLASTFTGGDVHAGLSFDVTKSIALEGFYKPQEQEWAAGDVVVGARFQL